MKRILFFVLTSMYCCLLLAQTTGPSKKCSTCGKSIPLCEHKGKHPIPPTPVKETQPQKKVPSVTSTDPDAKYALKGYMDILTLLFVNSDGENITGPFGVEFYASDLKYLRPIIQYRGLASKEKVITLDVKIINADGELERGTNSPAGYTYSYQDTIKPVEKELLFLSGWGNLKGGTYKAGKYTFEIWYKNTMIYQTNFMIWSGSIPVEKWDNFKITNTVFANVSIDGKNINEYGETFHEGDIQYVKPKIFYDYTGNDTIPITLQWKFFNPKGILIKGTNSPLGYTFQRELTIIPGTNSVELDGYGSKSTEVYLQGTHRVEFWINDKKAYQTEFYVMRREDVASFLKVDGKSEVTSYFSSSGGLITYSVLTDAENWEVWGVPSWCNIKEKRYFSFTLECEPNHGKERCDFMKVRANGKEVKINIHQLGLTSEGK